MVHIETTANRWLDIIASYEENLRKIDGLRDIDSERSGNIDTEMIALKVALQDNLAKYKSRRGEDRRCAGDYKKEAFERASEALYHTVEDLQRFWDLEVLPILQDFTQRLEEEIPKEEIITEEKKDFVEKIKTSSRIISKILKSGKKTWELINEYKMFFVTLGKIIFLREPSE